VVVASSATDWATVAVTAFLGLVTIFVGLSIHLKRRQEIAAVVTQKGYEAYSSLWELIPYSPELQELQPKQRLKPEDRDDLFDKMTAWYYGSGRGMMLGDDTRGIYLTAKKNLICKVGEFVPTSARKQIGESEEERTRQCASASCRFFAARCEPTSRCWASLGGGKSTTETASSSWSSARAHRD
jgi:hypothetical protein